MDTLFEYFFPLLSLNTEAAYLNYLFICCISRLLQRLGLLLFLPLLLVSKSTTHFRDDIRVCLGVLNTLLKGKKQTPTEYCLLYWKSHTNFVERILSHSHNTSVESCIKNTVLNYRYVYRVCNVHNSFWSQLKNFLKTGIDLSWEEVTGFTTLSGIRTLTSKQYLYHACQGSRCTKLHNIS